MLLQRIFSETWPGAFRWWVALCSVTLLNVMAWVVATLAFRRRRDRTHPETYNLRRTQVVLSAVFVVVCGFRSVFPRADVQRICLHDLWLSSVGVGRSLATIAELCFIAQWAILLRELGESTRTRLAITVSRLLVPFIAVAECCSWYAVLTTCYAGNAIEESIWALCATLATASAVAMWPRLARPHRLLVGPAILFGAAYVGFMCTVDVPMYVSRFLADQAHGRHYLSLLDGLRDASVRWVATDSWAEWRTEIPWMSLYFSVVVWISISLMHAPRFSAAPQAARARPARLSVTATPNAGKV